MDGIWLPGVQKLELLLNWTAGSLCEIDRVGRDFERRPYEEYLKEIADTGVARLKVFGAGLFENGRVVEWKTPEELGGTELLVHPEDNGTVFRINYGTMGSDNEAKPTD